jgi:CheY-like chemotaxis protein
MAPRVVRLVVVDEDRRVHQLCERVLRPPEFHTFSFVDPCAGLMGLRDVVPDVIVCSLGMRGLDGKTFYRAVKCSPVLCDIPFIFLTADLDGHHEAERMIGPRDECLRKPVPVRTLVERIRARARPTFRSTSDPAKRTLSGITDRKGLLALLKLCEDARLTGRFNVEAGGRTLWVDWLAGAMTSCGALPAATPEAALDMLLEADGGRYGFEPRPVEAKAQRRRTRRSATTAHGPVGRFSILDVGGRRLQIHTEGEHRPNFSITTVVATAGRGVRKVETCWPHPLKRSADYEVAREQIEEQHESVLAMVRDGALAPQQRRAIWEVAGGSVEGSRLVWVMILLSNLAQERIGTLPSLALLRRTLRRSAMRQEALHCFRVEDDSRVSIDVPDDGATKTTLSGWRLPRGVVEGVALWALAFQAEVAALAGAPRLPTVRRATRMVADELEEIGFYQALEDEESHGSGGSAEDRRAGVASS